MDRSAWSRREFLAQAAVTGSAFSIGLAGCGDAIERHRFRRPLHRRPHAHRPNMDH